jgi:hypothetical protein
MVALKCTREIPLFRKKDWHTLVMLRGRYFEVIFVGDVFLDSVECVRVLKVENDAMWDLAFASYGRKLEPAERALAQDFIVLRRGVVEDKVCLEVVA